MKLEDNGDDKKGGAEMVPMGGDDNSYLNNHGTSFDLSYSPCGSHSSYM